MVKYVLSFIHFDIHKPNNLNFNKRRSDISTALFQLLLLPAVKCIWPRYDVYDKIIPIKLPINHRRYTRSR
jgi:hypothetical protein